MINSIIYNIWIFDYIFTTSYRIFFVYNELSLKFEKIFFLKLSVNVLVIFNFFLLQICSYFFSKFFEFRYNSFSFESFEKNLKFFDITKDAFFKYLLLLDVFEFNVKSLFTYILFDFLLLLVKSK